MLQVTKGVHFDVTYQNVTKQLSYIKFTAHVTQNGWLIIDPRWTTLRAVRFAVLLDKEPFAN